MVELNPRLVAYGGGYGFPITYGAYGLMYAPGHREPAEVVAGVRRRYHQG
jgi:hypothetical protein